MPLDLLFDPKPTPLPTINDLKRQALDSFDNVQYPKYKEAIAGWAEIKSGIMCLAQASKSGAEQFDKTSGDILANLSKAHGDKDAITLLNSIFAEFVTGHVLHLLGHGVLIPSAFQDIVQGIDLISQQADKNYCIQIKSHKAPVTAHNPIAQVFNPLQAGERQRASFVPSLTLSYQDKFCYDISRLNDFPNAIPLIATINTSNIYDPIWAVQAITSLTSAFKSSTTPKPMA